MNFFGHAVIAGEYSTDPEFILGSMLPDFLSMLRIPEPKIHSRSLRQGVVFHHRTDAAFHESPAFLRLQRRAFAELTALGLRRGPARATAHVGIELLIDTAFAQALDRTPAEHNLSVTWSLYQSALERGVLADHPSRVFDDERGRLSQLCKHLAQLNRARFEGGPRASMDILRRAVSGRPRLELSSNEAEIARDWSPAIFPAVSLELQDVLKQVKAALGAQSS